MVAMLFLVLVYWSIITCAPNFRNLYDQWWEFSFEMGVQTLFTIIKTPLINLSIMQAKRQTNTEQELCVAMFVYDRDKRQDLVFIIKVLIQIWGEVLPVVEKKNLELSYT